MAVEEAFGGFVWDGRDGEVRFLAFLRFFFSFLPFSNSFFVFSAPQKYPLTLFPSHRFPGSQPVSFDRGSLELLEKEEQVDFLPRRFVEEDSPEAFLARGET